MRYGGTTFFEVYRPSWNESLAPNGAPVNNQCGYTSLTHPWSAGVTKWLSEEILGIRPLSPGFGSFLAAPHLTPDVHSVRGSMPTPHGTVRYSFDLKTGRGRLVVPDGTRATVGIPKSGRTVRSVLLGKRPAEQASDQAHRGLAVRILSRDTARRIRDPRRVFRQAAPRLERTVPICMPATRRAGLDDAGRLAGPIRKQRLRLLPLRAGRLPPNPTARIHRLDPLRQNGRAAYRDVNGRPPGPGIGRRKWNAGTRARSSRSIRLRATKP